MATVYTTRFLYTEGPGATKTYTVPDGKRAVVRSVFFMAYAAAGMTFWVTVHGITVVYWSNQAVTAYNSLDVRLVAYERETIQLLTTGPDARAMVTGFLFDDPYGPPAETKPTPPARPEIDPRWIA